MSIFSEFREFIAKGNVLDLAVKSAPFFRRKKR